MTNNVNASDRSFSDIYNGILIGLRQWSDWDTLTRYLRENNHGQWYVYYLNATVPNMPLSVATFDKFIQEIDRLLRTDHDEPYLGIVYVDDPGNPKFIKIYDPNNLGASCGCSGKTILPGWIISLVAPEDLSAHAVVPEGRRRWWARIFT
jgi:hypothetical protein